MSDYNKLVVFDCDGTMVDSQHLIIDVLGETFDQFQLTCPTRDQIRSIIGLSLDDAMVKLLPEADDGFQRAIAVRCEENFLARDKVSGIDQVKLFEGIQDLIKRLDSAGYLLAVATGKSQAGLDRVLAHHRLQDYFVSRQTADHHPSKPHPSMINSCISDAGSSGSHAVMIGDTSFDMEMAVSAGVFALGVNWGYHDPDYLRKTGANHVASNSDELFDVISAALK